MSYKVTFIGDEIITLIIWKINSFINSEFVEAFYFYNHIHNRKASCFSKANHISAVIFGVKEIKEALKDQVEIVDVGA